MIAISEPTYLTPPQLVKIVELCGVPPGKMVTGNHIRPTPVWSLLRKLEGNQRILKEAPCFRWVLS